MADAANRAIRIAAETGSTNEDLLAALKAGERVPEGEWLIADRQTAGRGRQGREWFDGVGNFMGSTVVWTGAADPPPHTLALAAGLALRETILPEIPSSSALFLKWPNDCLLDGTKLSGILLEREGDAIVIGIGVNLLRAPPLPDRRTIALAEVAKPPSRDAFAVSLAKSLEAELERWRTYGLEPLLRRWQASAHPEGTPLRVHEAAGTVLLGTYAGLDETGALRLRLPDGKLFTVHAGDVAIAERN